MNNIDMQKLIKEKLLDIEKEKKALIAFNVELKKIISTGKSDISTKEVEKILYDKSNRNAFCFHHNNIYIMMFLHEFAKEIYDQL